MRLSQILLAASMLASAANAASEGDWSTYGHDKGGQRFSPLSDITPANVAQLVPAWTYHMKPVVAAAPATPDVAGQAQRAAEALGPPPIPGAPQRRRSRFSQSEATPLVVGGRMFVPTPYGRVVALDPATGKELWATTVSDIGPTSARGVEYWPGDATTPARIVFGTREGKLWALDAATGTPIAGFGENGAVNLRTPEAMQGGAPDFYGMTSPPLIVGDLIITGSAVQEGPSLGAAGDIRAWDVRTGKLVWTFHTVPRVGEPGYETWAKGSAERRSGTNAWGFLTADVERGIVYAPLGAPTWDRYGGDRHGDNLYGSSVVALDVKTGKRLWHFQVVRHDIWDFDLEAPPLLFEAKGQPAVAVMSKSGLVFVLNRVTGKPIIAVEDRAVPASSAPGELAAKTQPFPVAPRPLGRTTMSAAELTDLTPELNAWCADYVKTNNIKFGSIYTPIGFNQPTVSLPGTLGAMNWGGGAYDARSGVLYVNTQDLGQVQSLVASKGALPVERGPVNGRFWQQDTRLLCQKGPWGQLHAVEAATGKVLWQTVLGTSDNAPEGKQATGRPNIGGPIVTAGGLIFIAGTDDARFRAYDAKTGREVWAWKLDASAHATPMTYRGGDGRQYVAIVATGGSFLDTPIASDSVMAFALPEKAK